MLLKQKVYLSLILAILLPLGISTFIFSSSIKTHAVDKLTSSELPTALNEVRNAIELELASPIIISQSIAQNYFVKAWLSNGEAQSEKDSFITYLAHIKRDNKAINAFIVSKASGNYYTNNGLIRQITAKDDAWFYDFLNSTKSYELSLDIDKNSGEAVVFINYAIEINGVRSAVAGIGRSLKSMTELIQGYKIGESGFVYLVDGNGKIKLHANKNEIEQPIDLSSIKNGGISNVNHDGKDFIISSSPLESLDWHLVAEIPQKELYGPIDQAINQNLLFGLVIALIGFALVRILAKQIFKPIEIITNAVAALTEKDGDLTARLPVNDKNEISELAAKFNLFLEQLHSMFKQVSTSANHVKEIAGHVDNKINTASNLAEEQSSSTQTVAAAVNEMEMTVQDISSSASGASEIAISTQATSKQGSQFVNNTIIQMGELEASMASSVTSVLELSTEIKSITHVLDVIKGISEQTNLLALNAAIEAARAGEQGRGFAVVADEVRTLAQRTAESTEQINAMIDTLNSKAETTVTAIELGSKNTLENAERLNQTGIMLEKISQEIVNLTEINTSVATATKEQTMATSEISQNIVMISDSANQTKENMGDSAVLCSQLDKESQTLKDLIGRFTL